MSGPDRDRPFGDDGFTNPKKHGWATTVLIAVVRAITGVGAGTDGRQWPRQLPLDQPDENRDYRP
ncbi:hypothetical protein [Curtobacterium sp. PhB136]|uniref:hypothetical protein n=1 Tax=Curtobacterium sp. PhB136 TaxID=2485181 RepID=UPI00104555D5|nr:hypothetical protein [Curtobacterium sp. PhB136]TCK64250.1 hypothetical protein EDF27_1499 [Curtobacterium sp. PhB136]